MTETPAPTRIVIVDDHPMVAEGVEAILETYDDIEVVATLSDGQQIIDQVSQLAPDVILLDLNMPGIGGLSTTEIILERRPATRILILSMHDSPEYISSALSHGAMGYVLKDVPTDEIKLAIDAVMRGERYLCTGAQGSLEPQGGAGVREQLTNREQTILLQLAQGRSNKDVALALDISVRTVETHRKNIKRKLGISSTAGLTRYALEHGVLQGTGVSL
ncbi:response regulator transcription factor [Roseovarius nubinhibens]|jgi:two-component system NarL family response regulator|uniref:DNA-binding response regulator, LuxR family protein n=1 Tax=Roseovarius nubinhibens (strain ATCC BAA-591 / DSM 15170 / ISM) TaxID=89187 RepID=A3SP50_ROSNI|nr:response regulator transcription factor [Roseovarius nubinhibens]EAP76240.1 DNA-binding response regulator, LuxR family protein [Roseovarius nubinhibens ISM]MBU3001545.1 response regulator transcription factor [Roseovarius nubinhibens]